ncbi:hypothetical protein J7L36_02400 [bacterium]|nr:hypothetical protein [bacterium]
MTNNCPFCKIIEEDTLKQIQKDKGDWIVIDSKPKKSNFHKLIISKDHTQDLRIPTGLIEEVVRENNLENYKLMCNFGSFAEIPHLHWHILA